MISLSFGSIERRHRIFWHIRQYPSRQVWHLRKRADDFEADQTACLVPYVFEGATDKKEASNAHHDLLVGSIDSRIGKTHDELILPFPCSFGRNRNIALFDLLRKLGKMPSEPGTVIHSYIHILARA